MDPPIKSGDDKGGFEMTSREMLGWMLFLIPLTTFPLTFNQFEFPKLILFYLLSLVILLAGLIGSIKPGKLAFVKHPGLIALGGFLGLYVLSTLRSTNLYTSIFGLYPRAQDGLLLLICSLIVFFSVLNALQRANGLSGVRRLLIYAGIAGVFEIIYGGYQYLIRLLANTGGEIRVAGLEDHPIYFATFIMVSSFNFWFLAYSAKTKAEQRFWLVMVWLAFMTILGSLTRSVWVSTALAVCLVIGLLYFGKFFSFRTYLKGKVIFLLTVPVTIAIILLGPAIKAKVNQTLFVRADQNNIYVRAGELKGIMEVIKHNWFLGSGPATLIYTFPKYRPIELNYTQEWDLGVDYARNVYLNYAATAGIPALIFYLIFIGATFILFLRRIYQSLLILRTFCFKMSLRMVIPEANSFASGIQNLKQDREAQLSIVLLGGWASLVIQGLFYHWTITSNLYFWVFSGILAGLWTGDKQVQFRSCHCEEFFKEERRGPLRRLSEASNLDKERFPRSACGLARNDKQLVKLGLAVGCLVGLVIVTRIFLADLYYTASSRQANLLSGKVAGSNSYLFFQDHFAVNDLPIINTSIQLVNKSISLFPFNEVYRRQLVYLLLVKAKMLQTANLDSQSQQTYLQAIGQAKQTVDLNNKNSLNYYFLALADAQAASQIGDLAQAAIDNMKIAVSFDQTNPMMLNNLGLVYLQQNKLAEAQNTFKQAIGLKKDLAESYYHLGESLKQQGKAVEAIKVYEQVLHFEPDNQFARQEIQKAKDVRIP